MMILHCMPAAAWETARTKETFGEASVSACGFVHCSSVEYMWRVAPNFLRDTSPLVLLLIDADMIPSEIRWEDADNVGRTYPHVYGPIPVRAVVQALPFLKQADGSWHKNPELEAWPDR